jgi:hypothetical protein
VLALLGVVGVWQLQVLADAALANPGAEAIQAATRSGQIVVGCHQRHGLSCSPSPSAIR